MVIANYLDIEEINFLFKNKARRYKKKASIFARQVSPDEEGKLLTTYISDSESTHGYREETTCILSKNMVIARNPKELCDKQGNPIRDKKNNLIYNEYAMPKEIFQKNYHALNQLSTVFNKKYYKKNTIIAIEINDKVISILRKHNQLNKNALEELRIKTSWGDELIQHGGLLTNENYSISKKEFLETYVIVEDTEEKNFHYPQFRR